MIPTPHGNAYLRFVLAGELTGFMADFAAEGTNAPECLWLSVYTAKPAHGGSQSTNEVSYTGHARAAIDRAPASWTFADNVATSAVDIALPARTDSGSDPEVTWWAIGTAQTGTGEVLFGGVIGPQTVVRRPTLVESSNNLLRSKTHPFVVDDRVVVESIPGQAVPVGTTDGEAYFVRSLTGDDQFDVKFTQGGGQKGYSADGSFLLSQAAPLTIAQNVAPTFAAGSLVIEAGVA